MFETNLILSSFQLVRFTVSACQLVSFSACASWTLWACLKRPNFKCYQLFERKGGGGKLLFPGKSPFCRFSHFCSCYFCFCWEQRWYSIQTLPKEFAEDVLSFWINWSLFGEEHIQPIRTPERHFPRFWPKGVTDNTKKHGYRGTGKAVLWPLLHTETVIYDHN